MKALRIQVDFTTGKRAGGIRPKRDKNLPCNTLWQNTGQGVEIRLVKDGDVSKYEGVEGVKILDGEVAIDAAVQELQQGPQYLITNEALLVESIKQKNITIADISPELDAPALAKELYGRGALGITKTDTRPPTAKEMGETWEAKADSDGDN